MFTYICLSLLCYKQPWNMLIIKTHRPGAAFISMIPTDTFEHGEHEEGQARKAVIVNDSGCGIHGILGNISPAYITQQALRPMEIARGIMPGSFHYVIVKYFLMIFTQSSIEALTNIATQELSCVSSKSIGTMFDSMIGEVGVNQMSIYLFVFIYIVIYIYSYIHTMMIVVQILLFWLHIMLINTASQNT